MTQDDKAGGLPRRIGRYRLIRLLSKGGMAEIYEARRESNFGVEPKVAIKVIQPERSHDDNFRKLFITEAQIGSTLEHQNLIQIQDFDQAENQFFLVMEYIEGMTLYRVMRLSRKYGVVLPEGIIAEIGRQLCDGLYHAHRTCSADGIPLGLVHRDIKPSNLMISPQGVVKILDFGLSSAVFARERKGAVRGTWGYMAPEQMMGEAVTQRTDLYALAVVLFELATLTPLFPDRDQKVLKGEAMGDEAARRANALGPEFSKLKPILVRALQRDPAARYQNAEDMGRALAELVPELLMAREQIIELQKTILGLVSGGRPYTAPIVFEENVSDAQGAFDDDNETKKAGLWFSLFLIPLLVSIILYGIFREEPKTNGINIHEAIPLPTDVGDRYALPQGEPSAVEPKENLKPPIIPKAPSKSQRNPQAPPLPAEPIPSEPVVTEAQTVQSPIPVTGRMTIAADRPAKVFVGGQFIREAPLVNYEIAPGEYRIILVRSNDIHQRKVFQAVIAEGENMLYHWSFEEDRWLR